VRGHRTTRQRNKLHPPVSDRSLWLALLAALELAYEKVGADSNHREQSDAEHRLLMSAHSCLGFAGSKGTHDGHTVFSFLAMNKRYAGWLT
jgi:hypothetical protein